MLTMCFLTGCAHPNYEDGILAPGNPDKKTEAECPLHFVKANLCAKIVWKTSLTEKTGAIFELTSWDPLTATTNGPYSDMPNTKWAISIYMPSMGHGSSPVKISSLSSGVSEISKVFFFMPGAWEVRFQLIDTTNQVVDQFFLDMDIP